MAVAPRLDATGDARSAAERGHGRVGRSRPVKNSSDVAFAPGVSDDVGRARIVARKAAHQLGIRLAVGVRRAVIVVASAKRERARRGDAGDGERDLVKRRRTRAFLERCPKSRFRAGEQEDLLVFAQPLALAAPAKMFRTRYACWHLLRLGR